MKETLGAARVDKGESWFNQPLGWVREKAAAVKDFYVETRLEMQRVTWPTRKQVQATTIVVVVTVFFFGFYFLVTDYIFGHLVNLVFRKLARG